MAAVVGVGMGGGGEGRETAAMVLTPMPLLVLMVALVAVVVEDCCCHRCTTGRFAIHQCACVQRSAAASFPHGSKVLEW